MTPTGLPALLAAAALLLSGCAGAPPAASAAQVQSTFVVVRHAEKAPGPEADPGLAEEGHARAAALARRLAGEPLVAVYTTDYRRTRATVAPAAQRHGLEPRTYDARQPARELIAGLRARHPAGTVLVAGHSNTVPEIVAALCGCDSAPMDESEYDRVSIVRFDCTGAATLEVVRDPARTP